MSENWLDAAEFSDLLTKSEAVASLQDTEVPVSYDTILLHEEHSGGIETDDDIPFPKEYKVVEVKRYRLKK